VPSTRLFPASDLTPADDLRQRIARMIEEAFADTPYPGDDNLCKPDMDGADMIRAFRGKKWTDVQINTLVNYHVDLPILTPESFRYYLPAFMLAILFYYPHLSTLPIGLIHSMTPPDPALLQKYLEKKTDQLKHSQITDFLNRVSVFTPDEKAAIRAFFEAYRLLVPDGRSELRHLPRALEFWRTA